MIDAKQIDIFIQNYIYILTHRII